MTDAHSKTILLVIPRGVAGRFILQTDILPTLQAAGVRVVALTPGGEMPVLSPLADSGSLVLEPLRAAEEADHAGRAKRLLRSVVRVMRDASLNAHRSPGFAGRYSRMHVAYRATWPRWISMPVHVLTTQLLWRSRALRLLVSRLDVKLSNHPGYARVIERHHPDMVVGEGLGYFPHDQAVYREAAKRGVKVAALVSGWDNPTTKGYRTPDLDLVVAWSERMREQIVSLHDVPSERVKVAGVPHWDPYVEPGALPSREQLCDQLGLDPSKRLVLHATFPPSHNPAPFEQIASTLAEATADGRLGDDVQLVIRLHPKFMTASAEAARHPYEALSALEGVHVTHPNVRGSELTLEDGRMLGALLKHCDVLVNVFSTTTLEGFLLDRPVVMAAPDPHLGEYDRVNKADPRRWNDFLHLRPLVDSGAARVARSADELVEQVRAYLADPSLERAQRREIARLECGPADGRAGERTARFLLAELGLRVAEPHAPAGGTQTSPPASAPGSDPVPASERSVR